MSPSTLWYAYRFAKPEFFSIFSTDLLFDVFCLGEMSMFWKKDHIYQDYAKATDVKKEIEKILSDQAACR